MKKILSLVLVLVLALGLMAGCGGSDEDASSGSASENSGSGSAVVNDGIISTADVNYSKDGAAVYMLVRPENETMDETTLGRNLIKKIRDSIGVAIKSVDDSSKAVDYEILLGPTSRPESKQAWQYLRSKDGGRYKDFIICTIGNKIVINAKNQEQLTEAVDYFISNFVKAEGVKGGINYFKKTEGTFADIKINGKSIGDFSVIRQRINSSYLSTVEINKNIDAWYNKTGFKLDLLYDTYTPEQDFEIIVGNTNRPGITKLDKYDSYEIKIQGSKVYLNGGSPHATAMAVSEFGKLLASKSEITDADSVTNGSYEQAMKGYDRATTYYPTFTDNFDGAGVDTSKWRLQSGTQWVMEGQNGKKSVRTDDPNFVFISDGKLYMVGHETETEYVGASMLSDKTVEYLYGYIEYSAICPNGPSFWTTLWLNTSGGVNSNGSYYAEIDVNECFGNATLYDATFHALPTNVGKSTGGAHYVAKVSGEQVKYYCPDGKTWADDFHTFGFIWDQNHLATTTDGEIFRNYDVTASQDDMDAFTGDYMFIQLSFNVGAKNNPEKAENLTEEHWTKTNKYIIDWVNVYQFDDGIQNIRYLK